MEIKILNQNKMTFKTAKLPCTLFIMFDGDEERYKCELSGITDIDKANDKCTLLVDGIMPQRARLKVPYSILDSEIINPGTGIRLGLTPNIK